jgi:hypothetical protein
VKRLLGYVAGIGLGAAVAVVISKRRAPPALGHKPRRSAVAGGSRTGRMGKLGATLRHAVDEGRRVMKQTEEELAKQVASPGDGSP